MDEIKETLEWYSERVLEARSVGVVGDIARAKLDRDGGRKARQALEKLTALGKFSA